MPKKLPALVLAVIAACTIIPAATIIAPAAESPRQTFLIPDESQLGVHTHTESDAHAEEDHDHEEEALTRITLPVDTNRPVASATGPRSIKVRMLVPNGVPQDAQPASEATIRASIGEASRYWSEQTAGAVSFNITSFQNWAPAGVGCQEITDLWENPGNFNPGANETYLIILPKNAYRAGCQYGLGTIGSSPWDPGYAYVSDSIPSVIAHELGHNISLGHANAASCFNAAPDPINANPWTCSNNAPARYAGYGDAFDIMASSGAYYGSANAAAVASLNLLPRAVARPTSTQTYDLFQLPFVNDGLVHAIQFSAPSPTGGDATYTVELRGVDGRDVSTANGVGLTRGVRIIRNEAFAQTGTAVIDATPTRDLDNNRVIPVGGTFSTSSGGVHVSVLSVNGPMARVKVTFGAAPAPLAQFTDTFNGIRLQGAILSRYQDLGGPASELGLPTTGEITLRNGAFTHFQNGSIYWSPSTGAQVVKGAIKTRWADLGWESNLGYPTSEEFAIKNGRLQRFQGGLVYWSAATGAFEVRGALLDMYGQQGWETGFLGYPTSGEIRLKNGFLSNFQGGSVYWSPAAGGSIVKNGALRDKWGSLGWENGYMGYPQGREFGPLKNGGYGQRFQGGNIYWSQASGAHTVRGAILAKWGTLAWENSYMGYPISDETTFNGGVEQTFQNGKIRYYWGMHDAVIADNL